MKTILVVEDELAIRQVLKVYLTKEEYHVVQAYDGLEAVNLFNMTQPSLVLLDVMLPGQDGWDVLQEIRKKSDCLIIMLTELDDVNYRLNGFNSGVDDYITKPFIADEVVARVKAVLKRTGKREQLLESNKQVEQIQLDTENPARYYMVKAPIETSDLQLGWVVILQSEQDVVQIDQEYRLLTIMLISLALLGWAAVYFVSRKLSHPIQHVAQAAQQVQKGNYDIELPDDIKEQEVYELVHSFKEMAERLQQLESMRTELLAGVTHELKTPVTSISGLLQAIKDDVVKGDEAKEFLEISLKETSRLQKMVTDLLAFNSFAANEVPISKEDHSMNELISEIIHAWSAVHNDQSISLQLTLLEKDQIEITIKDSGIGIPKEEQHLIFERFYRGENKKYKVRGLGLGLPFSKMIANALGGDLTLIESSNKGTTFCIVLPEKS